MTEWHVSKPFYGKGEQALQEALTALTNNGWRIFQILEPTLQIVAYRQKGKR
jgi:hypothetical protein